MVGLIILAVFIGYIILSLIVVLITYMKTKSKKKMLIALIIMFLIPTWDIILGYPIYLYFYTFKSGINIYKTVENVEGFYVGERDIHYEPHKPYGNYKYIDYKEMNYSKSTGKYYRSYWIDSNTSKLCVPIGKAKYGSYAKEFKNGRCIAKEEIQENAVSNYFFDDRKYWNVVYSIPLIRFKHVYGKKIIDRKNDETIAEIKEYIWLPTWLSIIWDGGFPSALSKNCFINSKNTQTIEQDLLNTTLKPAQGNNDGNN